MSAAETFLMDAYSCRSRLVWAYDRDVAPHFENTAAKVSDHTVCWLIERGHVLVVDDRGEVRAQSGDWLFLRASDAYQHFSPRSRVLSIRFDLRLRGGKQLFRREQHRVFKAQAHPELEWAARLLVDLFARWGTSGSLLIGRSTIPLTENFRIEAAFMNWLSAYTQTMLEVGAEARMEQRMDERVRRALALLDEHPMREKFSEERLASACGLSANQLRRLFKLETHRTPFDYFEARRLELAEHALTETAMPVKEIAFELGFNSSPHFSNWFRQQKNQSPRAFRNSA